MAMHDPTNPPDPVSSDVSFIVPGALSDHQLEDLIDRLREREHDVSYERRMLHAKIDLLRVEQVTRLRRRYASEPGCGDRRDR